MLLFSMSASADGYIHDRDGNFDWGAPSDELFAFHLARVRELGAHICGRRLYEAMLVWETDPSLRETPLRAEFADVWTALPKVVFSRTLHEVQGNARLAQRPLAEEIAAVLNKTERNVEIGGATLAAEAIQLGLVDEFHLFRYPILVGDGKPYFPSVSSPVPLRLVESQVFEDRVVYERYDRAERPAVSPNAETAPGRP